MTLQERSNLQYMDFIMGQSFVSIYLAVKFYMAGILYRYSSLIFVFISSKFQVNKDTQMNN